MADRLEDNLYETTGVKLHVILIKDMLFLDMPSCFAGVILQVIGVDKR